MQWDSRFLMANYCACCLVLTWLVLRICFVCVSDATIKILLIFFVTLNVTPLFFSFCWFQTIFAVQSKMERVFCFIQYTSKQWSFCAEKFNWKNRSRVGPIEFSRTFYLLRNTNGHERRKICGIFLISTWKLTLLFFYYCERPNKRIIASTGKLESDFFWNFVMISFSSCVKRS